MKDGSMKDEELESSIVITATANHDAHNLVGRYVRIDGGGGFVIGKVSSHDAGSGLFNAFFEDGHCRCFDRGQLDYILLAGDEDNGVKVSVRKRKLDHLLSSTPPDELRTPHQAKSIRTGADADGIETSSSGCGTAVDNEGSVSSDGDDEEEDVESLPEIQPVELPPSSGDIAVPEGSVCHLFSVYNFLRSFSIQLFLSPFSIDDFVGSVNCTSQNSLLDAIHVALLRAMRHHLQNLSSEGSEPASRCLRYHDWSLLDHLTWPVFVVEYLFVMGHMKALGGKNFRNVLSGGDYYKLPVALKLEVLQILCDEVVSFVEIRTELEMRENLEDEADAPSSSFPLESESRRVQTRSSKSVAGQSLGTSLDSSQAIPPSSDSSNHASDANSDECRLCGMDGTLVCCDGCPSAYHSRCIGLNKAFLPSGLWFCPECTIDKLGLTCSRIGRGIKGAEVFGIDPCGRMFLGTCNYLLVIETILKGEPFARYYDQNDVPKILNLILSASNDKSLYVDICEVAVKYWGFSLEKPELAPVGKELLKFDFSSNVTSDNKTNAMESSVENENQINVSVLDSIGHSVFPDSKNCDQTSENKPMGSLSNNHFVSNNLAVHKVLPVIHMNTNQHFGSVSSVTAMPYSNSPASGKGSFVLDTASGATATGGGIWKVNTISSGLSTISSSVTTLDGKRPGSQISELHPKTMGIRTVRKPASFKPQGYVNQYIQGDVSASAAANLAVLTSEENRPSEMHASSNPRKVVSASITLQMKAFSESSMHFVWPCYEKKVMEVPRERCGWCIACKGAATTRRGCLLNLVAANAVKGNSTISKGTTNAAKGFSKSSNGSRTIKHEDNHFAVIAAYIACLEESLHGLLVGPFLNAHHNQQWHKELREASSCRAVKATLLELEKNIRGISFTGNWHKLVHDGTVAVSKGVVGASSGGPTPKRGPGRRPKKVPVAECVSASSDDKFKDVQWWRGGKLQKFVYEIGSLATKLIRKAARQGGSKRMAGLCYGESSDIPRRSRQLAWRASVEMSKNASQLALQVRYLDAHIRWRDLMRPEQNSVETKASDVDSSIFRNAVLCDKKITENKIVYALSFSNQKHLPLRITKNILEKEVLNGENAKLWFSENHVPLYMIKDYEQKISRNSFQGTTNLGLHTKLGKKQLKNQRNDIFAYLVRKRDGPSKSSCPSCKQDVLLRDSATCGICQGSCHKDCTLPLIDRKQANLTYTITCKICYHSKTAALNSSRKEIMNIQLPSKRQDNLLQLAVPKSVTKVKVHPQMSALISDLKNKSNSRRDGVCLANGLEWKQKNDGETGQGFRFKHIILKNMEGVNSLTRPTCCLCRQPYRSDLMYLCCEKCLNWYHADALNVEEHHIFDLVGFKCCKNRKKSSLRCPYVDPNYNKTVPESCKGANTVAKMSEHAKLLCPNKIPFEGKEDMGSVEDPVLNSFGMVKPVQDSSFMTRGMTDECTDYSTNQSLERNDLLGTDWQLPEDNALGNAVDSTNVIYQWDDQGNGNFQDMEYEPQTYFSFTELLASDDGQLNPSDGLSEVTENGLLDLSFSLDDVPVCDGPFGSETTFSEVACSQCKVNQPSPDLNCEICGLLIHSHCSPWVEGEGTIACTTWRCGHCRDWR